MLVRGVCRVTHCALRAPFGQTRQARPRSGCVLRHTRHPAPCASRHVQKGKAIRAIAALGLALRGAKRRRLSEPSAAMARVGFPPLLEAPASGRLRGGMRACARMLRCLTRRDCSNGAPQARSEFHGAPRRRPDAGCGFLGSEPQFTEPAARPKGAVRSTAVKWVSDPNNPSQPAGACFFCLLFLHEQEKKVARRGETRPPPCAKHAQN